MKINKKQMRKVIEVGYEYLGTYEVGEYTKDKSHLIKTTRTQYMRVRCSYCGNEYDVHAGGFINNKQRCDNCCNKYENSFAYYIQQVLQEPLNEYWDWEKNTLNPYCITIKSGRKVILKCNKVDYHDTYSITPAHFVVDGCRCPQCSSKHGKVHKLDSFGAKFDYFTKFWSMGNNKSPYEVTEYSHIKYKFKCEECSKEFNRSINNIRRTPSMCKCSNCTSSKGEKKINIFLTENNINFKPQKNYDNLIGIRGGQLSYDFYLPKYNLLIEYQGEQHEKYIHGLHFNYSSFERQEEHDRRKREYASINNIKLLEIWYWDLDNIEKILSKELDISMG